MKSRNAFFSALILVIGLGLLAWLLGFHLPSFNFKKTASPQNTPLPKQVQLPSNYKFATLTDDFPWEKGSQFYAGQMQISDNLAAASKAYQTNRSISDNLKTFKEYFTSHGWQVTTDEKNKNMALLEAKDEQKKVTIDMYFGEGNNGKPIVQVTEITPFSNLPTVPAK